MINLGLDLVFAFALYAIVLLVIGVFGRQARRDDTMTDRFLGGRTIGAGVLFFTFFATTYSGNSFSGFPGQTYREGMAYFMSVSFMVAVVAGYLLFAPRLFRLSREHHFVTPTDFLNHRFGSAVLNYVSAAIFLVVLSNFLLAQLTALGQAFSGLTGGQVPAWPAIVVGGGVVLTYQLMGGMRAVAWSDVFHGALMFLGYGVVIWLLWTHVGSPAEVVQTVRLLQPDHVSNPSLQTSFVWLSNFLLLALGAPLYPQAVQRVYAARALPALRRSLTWMAVIPLVAGTTVVFIGAAGIALFPNLGRIESDAITFRVVAYLVESSSAVYYPAMAVMLAIIAAILSTADSCLLSAASVFIRDLVARRRGLSPEETERFSSLVPAFSIGLMAVLMVLAMRPLTTLWGLLIIKFEILIQLSPAFVLGTMHTQDAARAYQARDIMAGLIAGLVCTMGMYLSGLESLYGFHAGTVGVALNYAVVIAARRRRLRAGDITGLALGRAA